MQRLHMVAFDEALPTISVGCGSFEVSWLRCKDEAVAVFRMVDAFVFSAEVVAPVVLEVAGGDEGAEFQDGLGSSQAPPRARYVHSVLDVCGGMPLR